MNISTLHVAVIGGAIGGASAALLLARAGARVTLIERNASARAAGAGIALAENGLAVLAGLGLSEPLERVGCAIQGVRLINESDKTLFAPRTGQGAPRLLMVRRSELYSLLADEVARESRIDARYATELTELAADELTLSSAGRTESLRADLVIGADGVHSKVRASFDFGAREQSSSISYARGLAPAGLAQNVEAWTPAGLFGSFAVRDATYWYASLGTKALRRAVAERDLSALRSEWAAAYPASRALLSSLESFDQLLINRVVRVYCARFYSGQHVLIGDAAHAMAPNLGQGANSALLDAAALFDELARHDALPAALAAYDQRRRPKVQKVADTAARLGRLAEYTHPLWRTLRDGVLMPLAARSDPAASERMVMQEEPRAVAAFLSARLREAAASS